MSWFPKPKEVAAVQAMGPSHLLTPEQVFTLLHHDDARELPEKVGVTSPVDGSAKSSTRLLLCGQWFFKTDHDNRFQEYEEARRCIEKHLNAMAQFRVWHPQKSWYLIQTESGYFPLSVCPLMRTLRSVKDFPTRRRSWTAMIAFGLQVSREFGVCLDLNPSNFGAEEVGGRLYYLDDELLSGQLGAEYLSSVLMSRIQEENKVPPQEWREWGMMLRATLVEHWREPRKLGPLHQGILEYPLPTDMQPQRVAFLKGLLPESFGENTNFRPSKTLIFGDVHANYPALKVVLDFARQHGVDHFLFLGDLVGYGPFPVECIEAVANLSNATLISGNHDFIVGRGYPDADTNRMARETHQWSIDRLNTTQRAWLSALPKFFRDHEWLAVHGSPIDPQHIYAYVYELTYRDNLDYLVDNEIPICFYGHTHVPFIHAINKKGEIEKHNSKIFPMMPYHSHVLINPGSVGQPRDGDPRTSFALWDHTAKQISFHKLPYPIGEMALALKREGFPEDLATRLTMGR